MTSTDATEYADHNNDVPWNNRVRSLNLAFRICSGLRTQLGAGDRAPWLAR